MSGSAGIRSRLVLSLLACLPAMAASPQTAPPAPTNFVGTVQSTTSIRWTWTAVTGATGYVLHDGAHAVILNNIAAGATSVTETGLLENKQYTRHLHALNGTVAGGPSNAYSRYTFVHQAADADWSLIPISSTEVQVKVTPPANSALGSTGVNIIFWNGSAWMTLQTYAPNYTFNHAGLAPSTTYIYDIVFRNGDAWPNPAYAPSKSITTPSSNGLPAPANFAGTSQSTTSIRWTWTAVTGATGYVLHDAAHAVIPITIAAGATSVTETGLLENKQYTRHLHALNGTVAGGPSNAYSRYTLVHQAGDADWSVIAISPTEIQVKITPPPNSTLGLTGCSIIFSDGDGWTTLQDIAPNYIFNHVGLVPGTNYLYDIIFYNGDGTSNPAWAPDKARTTPSSNGLAVPATFNGAAQSTTSILWSWAAIAGATSYVLHDNNHNPVGPATITGTSASETGLGENSRYSRHVHAKNTQGVSPSSPTVQKYTAVHTPTTSDFSLSVISSFEIDITATPPVGSAMVEFQELVGSTWTVIQGFSTNYLCKSMGLVGGTSHSYRIRFQNGDAVPTAASPLKSMTTPPGPPASPPTIRITSYSGAVDVEWDPSPSPNVAGYNVYRKLGTTGTWQKLNTAGIVLNTKYRDAPVTNGQTYFYHVTSVAQ